MVAPSTVHCAATVLDRRQQTAVTTRSNRCRRLQLRQRMTRAHTRGGGVCWRWSGGQWRCRACEKTEHRTRETGGQQRGGASERLRSAAAMEPRKPPRFSTKGVPSHDSSLHRPSSLVPPLPSLSPAPPTYRRSPQPHRPIASLYPTLVLIAVGLPLHQPRRRRRRCPRPCRNATSVGWLRSPAPPVLHVPCAALRWRPPAALSGEPRSEPWSDTCGPCTEASPSISLSLSRSLSLSLSLSPPLLVLLPFPPSSESFAVLLPLRPSRPSTWTAAASLPCSSPSPCAL